MQLTAVQQARKPLVRQFQQLESQYEQQENITDPYRKLMHQAKTLDTMKALKEKMRHEIVLATPKPYQSRARNLFQHLEPILKFNERGEIFDENNQVIPESRFEDLIQYAVRDRRRHFLPTGWSTFINVLRNHNVPKYMLNRNTLDEMEISKLPLKPIIKSESVSEFKTPTRVEKWRRVAMNALSKVNDKKKVLKRKAKDSPIKQRSQRRRRQSTKYSVDFLTTF